MNTIQLLCAYSLLSLVIAQFFSSNFEKFNIIVYAFYYFVLFGYAIGSLCYLSSTGDLILLLRTNQTFVEWNHPILGSTS